MASCFGGKRPHNIGGSSVRVRAALNASPAVVGCTYDFAGSPESAGVLNCRTESKVPKREAAQQHGLTSRVYVPILREIVRRRYSPGTLRIEFTKRDIEAIAEELGLKIGNAADLAYRMRARTRLPDDILDLGFTVLRGVGRGQYSLEVGGEALVHLPEHEVFDHNDQTPLAVRRLLPENLVELDEQGILTIIGYCKLLDHFTGLTVYRLRSHVRKSVPNVGQAELDEIDVGIALRDDDLPVVFPLEAKAADEVINRVQVATAVAYCQTYSGSRNTPHRRQAHL